MRGLGTAVVAALLVTGVTAGTASATTLTKTGSLTYNCPFPGITPQPTTVAAELSVTDPHPGLPFTVSPSLQQTFPTSVRTLLNAIGYDAVRGSLSAAFSVTDATPAAGVIAGGFPAQPFTTVTVTGAPQTFTAGTAGAVGFSLGASVSGILEFHKASTGAWTPWTSNCTLKVTSPAQNTAFTPSVPIT